MIELHGLSGALIAGGAGLLVGGTAVVLAPTPWLIAGSLAARRPSRCGASGVRRPLKILRGTREALVLRRGGTSRITRLQHLTQGRAATLNLAGSATDQFSARRLSRPTSRLLPPPGQPPRFQEARPSSRAEVFEQVPGAAPQRDVRGRSCGQCAWSLIDSRTSQKSLMSS